MNLYEKFIEAIKPTWEITEPFPSYKDRDENSFRVLHLTQAEFEYLKWHLREELSSTESLIKFKKDVLGVGTVKFFKKQKKVLSEIQRKLKNESRP